MCFSTPNGEQSHGLENMAQICYLPEKAPSTSIAHLCQFRDLKHPSKYNLLLTLPFTVLQSSEFCAQCSSRERIHPQLPGDAEAVTADMINLGLTWGNARKWCEIPARTNREKSTTGPCLSLIHISEPTRL